MTKISFQIFIQFQITNITNNNLNITIQHIDKQYR